MTTKDFEILKSIVDEKDEEKGIFKFKGTSIKEIHQKTNFSINKIRLSLSAFLKEKLIEKGLKEGNADTYILTSKGIELLFEIKGEE